MTENFPEFDNDDELFPIPEAPVASDSPELEEAE